MKYILWCCLFLLSCNTNDIASFEDVTDSSGNDSATPMPPVHDTIVQTVTKAKAPIGIYEGTLPCADCKGIIHTVSFSTNQTFQLQEERRDHRKITVSKGTWKITDSLIWLYKDQVVAGRYKWRGDTLMFVDAGSGKSYSLSKRVSARENNVWKNKKKEGLEFFGVGNEPFWNIEIDEQNFIKFQLADWSNPLSFKPAPPTIYNDSTVYKTTSNADSLVVTIYNRFCNDGMSDFIYDNAVKVRYNNQFYNGCGLLYK